MNIIKDLIDYCKGKGINKVFYNKSEIIYEVSDDGVVFFHSDIDKEITYLFNSNKQLDELRIEMLKEVIDECIRVDGSQATFETIKDICKKRVTTVYDDYETTIEYNDDYNIENDYREYSDDGGRTYFGTFINDIQFELEFGYDGCVDVTFTRFVNGKLVVFKIYDEQDFLDNLEWSLRLIKNNK